MNQYQNKNLRKIWINSIVNHPWLIILMVIAIVAAVSYGGKNLYFRADYKVFFDKDFPQMLAHEEMQRLFNNNDNAALILVPKEGTAYARVTQRAYRRSLADTVFNPS